VADVVLLADPGREIYSRRTFGRGRYQSVAHNSFGHPVPLVAGKLQTIGRKARARIVRTAFSQQADVLEMDVTAAYNVKELKSLTRTFTYDRRDSGSLGLRDRVRFSSPQPFETALITFGRVEKISDDTLRVTEEGKSAKITITTDGPEFSVTQTTLKANFTAGTLPTRVDIRLIGPVTAATVHTVIEPM